MKNLFLKVMILTSILGFIGCKSSSYSEKWSSSKIDKWFEKGEWLNGWNILPDKSINRKEFAASYFKNKDRWDKAFSFLKSTDLSKLPVKRAEIDGDNVYALVQDYLSKNDEAANFEAHRKYADIQYVINGAEIMEITPLTMKKAEVTAYNASSDIEYMTVTQKTSIKATPERFFMFFPSDSHRPGMKDGENSRIRKVVVKVKLE
jgi:YhcH/YjgK/YiaL family protein